MLGDAKEMYWLHKTYSDKEIMDVARKSRGFDDVSANYLSQKYSIDRKDMAYYINKEKREVLSGVKGCRYAFGSVGFGSDQLIGEDHVCYGFSVLYGGWNRPGFADRNQAVRGF